MTEKISVKTPAVIHQTKRLPRFRRALFLLLLLLFAVTYFTKDRFKSTKEILPAAVRAPLQTTVTDNLPLSFEKKGFTYELQPLYDYEITGLVVHTRNYDNWYSLSRTDKLFTTDICMIWGKNLDDKIYLNNSLKISQDYRFCLFSYAHGPALNSAELSNNHLLLRDGELQKIASRLAAGDQVKIKGKLVNAEAKVVGQAQQYEYTSARWNTSTNRTDTGAGACEIIYVQSIEILKKGNPLSHWLYTFSKYALLLTALWMLADFILTVFTKPKIYLPAKPKDPHGIPNNL